MSFWFKPQASSPPSNYTVREMSYDLSRLPNIPWSVWPEMGQARTAVIRDATNEPIFELKAFNSRGDLLEIAKFLEEATRK